MPLKVCSRPGSSLFWIVGTVGGRRIRESAGTDDAGLAEEKRAVREAELFRAAVHGEKAPEVTFASAALSYLKVKNPGDATRIRVGKLVKHFGPTMACSDIKQARIDGAAEKLLRPGFAPATKLREIVTPVRTILNHAARRGWCSAPSFEIDAGDEARTDWLKPTEATALIEAAADHLRPLITFLICCGPRLGEALDLNWSDVDLAHARVVLRKTKSKKDRQVDLPPRAVAALSTIAGRTGRVFRRPDGEPYSDKARLGGGQVKTGWAAACRRAELPGKWVTMKGAGERRWQPVATPHTCRHTYASWHYAMHRDLLRLKIEGGWASTNLVERYAHLTPGTMKGQIENWLTSGTILTHSADAAKKAS